MRKLITYTLLALALTLQAQDTQDEPPPTPRELLQASTRMVPREKLTLTGTLTKLRYRGSIDAQSNFKLTLNWGAPIPEAECLLYTEDAKQIHQRASLTRPHGQGATIRLYDGTNAELPPPRDTDTICGTDLTWLDLTMDYLWWTDVREITDHPDATFHGRDCYVLEVKPPRAINNLGAIRLWVDKKLRFFTKAEYLDPTGRPYRHMWVQKVKKMDDRWMISDMEVETLNSNRRTRLLVDELTAHTR